VTQRQAIVVAGPPMQTGGTEQHLLHVLPALVDRGFDITVVLLAGGGALEQKLREHRLTVRVPRLALPRPLRTGVQAFMIRSAVQQSGARVVHAFLSEPYIAATMSTVMLVRNRPALVHGRRSLAFYAKRHAYASKVERMSHRFAAALVGNSTAVAAELMVEAGSHEKVCVIHNGIPQQGRVTEGERRAARAHFGVGADQVVIAKVANFHPYKGHSDLIRGLVDVQARMPAGWRLLLAGRDAGAESDVKALIAANGLDDNVVFVGETSGSRMVYAAADIGVLVSHTEGFSNSLIEGMAAGLPMIATRVGGNVDAIQDELSGLLVSISNAGEIGDAILRLSHDAKLCATLGEQAANRAEAVFSLSSCVDHYERLWRGLANGTQMLPADMIRDPNATPVAIPA
jgi:glycosyltransferase involved in cell wall biosynthesis